MDQTDESIEIDIELGTEQTPGISYPPFSIGNYRKQPLRWPIVYTQGSPIPAKKAKRRSIQSKRQKEKRKKLRKIRLSEEEDTAATAATSPTTPTTPTTPATTPFTQSFTEYTQFSILPSYCFHPRIHLLLSFLTPSMKQRTHWMEQFKKKPFQGSATDWKPSAAPIQRSRPMDTVWSLTLVRHLSEAVQTTLNLRYRFRTFLHRWRSSRLKQANTEDPVLCDPPQFPIYLVDWSSDTRYIFDASTILQDLDSRLLHCDGFFDQSLPPRNSFTNERFTLSQKVSVWNQLRSFSKQPSIEPLFSWAYIGYKKASFSIKLFVKMYSVALKLHALRTTMADVKSWDSIDRLLDFIEYQHEVHNKHFLRSTYMFAIQHIPRSSLMVEWRKLCCYYYEADIKFVNNIHILRSIQDDLKKLTAPLCERPTELSTAYKSYLQEQAYEENDQVLLNLQQYIHQYQQAFLGTAVETGTGGTAGASGAILSDYDAVLQILNIQNSYMTPIPLPTLSIRTASSASSASDTIVDLTVDEEDSVVVVDDEDMGDLEGPPGS